MVALHSSSGSKVSHGRSSRSKPSDGGDRASATVATNNNQDRRGTCDSKRLHHQAGKPKYAKARLGGLTQYGLYSFV